MTLTLPRKVPGGSKKRKATSDYKRWAKKTASWQIITPGREKSVKPVIPKPEYLPSIWDNIDFQVTYVKDLTTVFVSPLSMPGEPMLIAI